MKGEKNSFNLYVINKLTKPMTRLVKTIMGSQTATLLRNRFPKHVCIYGLTPCFTMRRLKIFRRIKTLRNTKVFHVPLFYFLQLLYLPSTRVYASHTDALPEEFFHRDKDCPDKLLCTPIDIALFLISQHATFLPPNKPNPPPTSLF